MDMADPINQTLPPTTPNLTNPQDLVDAALGPEPITPIVPTSDEPKTPPALPPLAPLSAPVPAEPVTQKPSADVAMGDDTPLAFAMPAPSSTPSSTPNSTEQSSYLPPVPPALPKEPEQSKKKSKAGIIVAGVMLLLLAVSGGVWGYYRYAQTAKVAMITGECTKNSDCGAGNQCTGGQCKPKPVVNPPSGGGGGNSGGCENPCSVGSTNSCTVTANGVSCAGTTKCVNACPGAWSACVQNDPSCGVNGGQGTCNEGETRDCSVSSTNDGTQTCSDGSKGKWSTCVKKIQCQVNSDCTDGQICAQNKCMDPGGPVGCGYVSESYCPGEVVSEPGGARTCDKDNHLCSETRTECKVPKPAPQTGYTWCFMSSSTKCSNGPDDSCVGGTSTPSTPPTTPTMSCKGLASTPDVGTTVPAIGDKVVFTCSGEVVPSTAGTLSFKFRYNINSGAYSALVNKTATTTELLIDACGSYSVECQACATLGGTLTCDPIWTGATTQ